MKLKIFGSNLRDQSKGQFVVHTHDCADCADCADCKKLEKLKEHFCVEEHASVLSVSASIWKDMINEGSMTAADGVSEIHFAPCVAELPYELAVPASPAPLKLDETFPLPAGVKVVPAADEKLQPGRDLAVQASIKGASHLPGPKGSINLHEGDITVGVSADHAAVLFGKIYGCENMAFSLNMHQARILMGLLSQALGEVNYRQHD